MIDNRSNNLSLPLANKKAGLLISKINRKIFATTGLQPLSVIVDSAGNELDRRGLQFYTCHARRLWVPARQAALATLAVGRSVRFKPELTPVDTSFEFAGCGVLFENSEVAGAIGIIVAECHGGRPSDILIRNAVTIAENVVASQIAGKSQLPTI